MNELLSDILKNKETITKTAKLLSDMNKNYTNEQILNILQQNLTKSELYYLNQLNRDLNNLDRKKQQELSYLTNIAIKSDLRASKSILDSDGITSMLFSCFANISNVKQNLSDVFKTIPLFVEQYEKIHKINKEKNELELEQEQILNKGLTMEKMAEKIDEILDDFETNINLNDNKNLLSFVFTAGLENGAIKDENQGIYTVKNLAKYAIKKLDIDKKDVIEILTNAKTYDKFFQSRNLKSIGDYREDFYNIKNTLEKEINIFKNTELEQNLKQNLKQFEKMIDEIIPTHTQNKNKDNEKNFVEYDNDNEMGGR